MVEEGREWDAHRKTKIHKRLANKAGRQVYDGEAQRQKRLEREQNATSTVDVADSASIMG